MNSEATLDASSAVLGRNAVSSATELGARLSSMDTVAELGMFLYWQMFENIVFFFAAEYGGTLFLVITNALKLLLPFALLAYTGLPSLRVLVRGWSGLYVFFFCAFLAWAIVPTAVSGNLIDYLKFL